MATSEICIAQPEPETAGSLVPALGHIRGKAVDTDESAVKGCVIRIRETNQMTHSDINGNFTLINVAPSDYTITAECSGYSPCISREVSIKPGDNPGFLFVMHRVR